MALLIISVGRRMNFPETSYRLILTPAHFTVNALPALSIVIPIGDRPANSAFANAPTHRNIATKRISSFFIDRILLGFFMLVDVDIKSCLQLCFEDKLAVVVQIRNRSLIIFDPCHLLAISRSG